MLDNSYIVFTLVSAAGDFNEAEGSSGQQQPLGGISNAQPHIHEINTWSPMDLPPDLIMQPHLRGHLLKFIVHRNLLSVFPIWVLFLQALLKSSVLEKSPT